MAGPRGGMSLSTGLGGVRAIQPTSLTPGPSAPGGMPASVFSPIYPDAVSVLAPNDGFGTAFCWGVFCIVALVALRWSLPGA